MDLKRNDSVMHVVFLHSRTGLIVTANSLLGLRDKIPFAFDGVQCVPLFGSHGLALVSADLF